MWQQAVFAPTARSIDAGVVKCSAGYDGLVGAIGHMMAELGFRVLDGYVKFTNSLIHVVAGVLVVLHAAVAVHSTAA